MTVTHKTGDLLQATEPAIAHGVNCHGVMGAGVARAIRAAYGEEMFDEYRFACRDGELLPGGVHTWLEIPRPLLLNVASQEKPGADARIGWLAAGMLEAMRIVKLYRADSVAVPRIGCGIGGLTWEAVEPVLITASLATGVDVAVYTP